MSQSNEINFGPVFMRGRKPAPITLKSNPTPNSNATHPTHNQFNQSQRSSGGASATNFKSHPPPTLGSFSPASNTSLPLPKSFSAAVSPGKETDRPLQPNGTQNVWDSNLNAHPIQHNQPVDSNHRANGHHIFPATDYSRETLLNLYSEQLASKLPPDLEIDDPAVSVEFVGPPLALIEMTEIEKELFAGPFNSEKRSAVNKTPHHINHDHSATASMSADGAHHHGSTNNKLSVGGPVKFGKHNPSERFNNLGIQGGVLAAVASPSHPNARRRGDGEVDCSDNARRLQRPDDSSANVTPWNSNPRDRRTRDSGPPSDGKWKRGVSFEEKMQASEEKSGVNNLKYSVLDKMREKAATNLERPPKEAPDSFTPAAQASVTSEDDSQLSLHTYCEPSPQSRSPIGSATVADESQGDLSATKAELASSIGPTNHFEAPSGPTKIDECSTNQPSSIELNPEDIAWQYRDPSGTVQGPFTAFQMQEWYKASFFRDDLLVKRVMDMAFETLETLILRVGDRDRPFLARPPPALPPNLPLPSTHSLNLEGQIPIPHPSSQTVNPSLSDPTFGLSPGNANSPLVESSIQLDSTSAPSQLGTMPASDPWHNIASRGSSLPGPGPPPTSAPLASGTAWNAPLPAFAHPNPMQNNDFVVKDGIIEFNNVLDMSHLSNSYVPPSEALRFLQQVQHPALSMATGNGYPFPWPLPQPPNFGQIPAMPHLRNATGIDHMLAAQLHSRLMQAGYMFRPPTNSTVDGLEPLVERPSTEYVTFSSMQADPWHVSSQAPNETLASATDQNVPQPPSMIPTLNQSAPFVTSDSLGELDPVGSEEANAIRPSDQFTAASDSPEPPSVPLADLINSKAESQPPSSFTLENDSVTFSTTQNMAPSLPLSSKDHSLASLAQETAAPTRSAAQAPMATAVNPIEPIQATSVTLKSSVVNSPSKSAKAPEVSTPIAPSWQNVTHQPTTKSPGSACVPAALAPAPPPVAPKTFGKVVVMTKAQQDEQDRRTASIQKAQLQLKEAQAVERAAREASEAAAAASATSLNTPAPWLKEEKSSSNLSLVEIQSIEAKQSEKRRLAEKKAAANRALAEQALAAERAAKASKEALPLSSNWAANASSPTKPNSSNTVWGSKETETPVVNSGPKQSMKQIQEEEARKKALALQQQSRAATATATNKAALGYASSVASNKPPVGGPWSVVGAKSKVTAPPAASARLASTGANSATGISSTAAKLGVISGAPSGVKPASKTPGNTSIAVKTPATKPLQSSANSHSVHSSNLSSNTNSSNNASGPSDGPPPASPEFMKWLREALRGMNNVDDFMKMLLDFPINPDESVLEIVSDSVYAGSATLDGRRFAKEFNARRMADVASRMINNKTGSASKPLNLTNQNTASNQSRKGSSNGTTMADAVKFQPAPKNDGWGFAVVGAKKKKK